jgi:transposase
MKKTQVARLLAYVTGMVNQQLLLQNEYLIAENRILRSHLPARLRLTDPQRATLATIGKRLGRQALQQVALVAKPETILGWYRKLIAQKFDGSKHRAYPGRPTVGREITELIVRMARENGDWGYDRIAGALKNLGHDVSDQTVGNVLRRFGIAPAPKRREQMNWHTSFALTWPIWLVSTSSPSRCSLGAGWQLITSCSSCTRRRAASQSPESLSIQRGNGWCRWLVMLST